MLECQKEKTHIERWCHSLYLSGNLLLTSPLSEQDRHAHTEIIFANIIIPLNFLWSIQLITFYLFYTETVGLAKDNGRTSLTGNQSNQNLLLCPKLEASVVRSFYNWLAAGTQQDIFLPKQR